MKWDKFVKTKKTYTPEGNKMETVWRRVVTKEGLNELEEDGKENVQEIIQGHLEECMVDGDKIAINPGQFEASEDQWNKNIAMNEDIVVRQEHLEQDNAARQQEVENLQRQIDELKKQQETKPAEPVKETT